MTNKLKTYTASYKLNDIEHNVNFRAASLGHAEDIVALLATVGLVMHKAFPEIELVGSLDHVEEVHFQSHSEH